MIRIGTFRSAVATSAASAQRSAFRSASSSSSYSPVAAAATKIDTHISTSHSTEVTLRPSRAFRSSLPVLYRGSGYAAPALFRPTGIARIPPQLLRFLIAGGAALLQVFVVAFERESRRLRTEEATGSASSTTGTAAQTAGSMRGTEAVQMLGLDRGFPELYAVVQRAETGGAGGAAHSFSVTGLPLPEGRAREEAKRNFDRLFELAVKENNMFLAGKLSAAYRVCVDPEWDQVEEVESGEGGAAAVGSSSSSADRASGESSEAKWRS